MAMLFFPCSIRYSNQVHRELTQLDGPVWSHVATYTITLVYWKFLLPKGLIVNKAADKQDRVYLASCLSNKIAVRSWSQNCCHYWWQAKWQKAHSSIFQIPRWAAILVVIKNPFCLLNRENLIWKSLKKHRYRTALKMKLLRATRSSLEIITWFGIFACFDFWSDWLLLERWGRGVESVG